MKINIILTILLLVYGYVNMVFENKLAAPFLAIVLIYVIWKMYDINRIIEEKDKKLDEIKELLEKSLNKNSGSEDS